MPSQDEPNWKIPVTREQFDAFQLQNWEIRELPQSLWTCLPKIHRPEDLVGVMISGTQSGPQIMHGFQAVAGVDYLALEPRPDLARMEPEGNAYHAIFVETRHPTHPYMFVGAFKKETIVPHWFNAADLATYFA